jgi:hypothetical protein
MTSNGLITPPRRRWGSRRAAWKQNRLAWSLRRAGHPTHAASVPELVIEGLREDDARALLDAVLTGLERQAGTGHSLCNWRIRSRPVRHDNGPDAAPEIVRP